MRIAGIYPNILTAAAKDVRKHSSDVKIQHAVSEPYGLEMILAVAKEQRHDVELFLPVKEPGQSDQEAEERLVERLMEFRPDVAGFSMYTCQYPMGVRIAAELKRRNPKIVTVGGNRYPSFLQDNTTTPFDFFVLKEGELTFRELLYALNNGRDFSNVRGLVYKNGNGAVSTGVRGRNFNLDGLPNALRFKIILEQVYKGVSIPTLKTGPHYAIAEYSRSCYNKCHFCDNKGFWGNKLAFRSPGRVVDELFMLKEAGVDIVYFIDLNFTAEPEMTLALCKEIIDRNVGISWYAMSNIATLDGELGKEMMRAMKQAGCFKIAYGVESTNENSLQLMNKATGGSVLTNEQSIRVLEASLEAGMINQGFYIIGFPWETAESIERDAEAIKELPLHLLNVGIFTPIPLSKFHKSMAEEGYEFEPDLERHDRNTLIYSHRSLTHERVKALQTKMHSDFYDSPEFMRRVERSCRIEPRFRAAFNEYFEFLGKEIRVWQ